MIYIQEVQNGQFHIALDRLRHAVNQGLIDPQLGTLPKQAQLLTELCIKLTPPATQQQGKLRIFRDLRKLFNPLLADAIRDHGNQGLRRLIRGGDREKWNKMASGATKGAFVRTIAVTPTLDMHRQHKLNMLRKNGRRPPWVVLEKDRGALNSVIREVQKRVSWAKSGWLVAYRKLGGTRSPGWVKHNAPGGITIVETGPRPFIDVRNHTSWGKYGEGDRIVANAFATRTTAMHRYFNTMMSLAARGIKTQWQSLKSQAGQNM